MDQHFRCRRPSGNANTGIISQPLTANIGLTVDQIGLAAYALSQFAKPVGIRAIWRANHQNQINLLGQGFDSVLAILGGVANIVFARAFNIREFTAQRVDHRSRIVHRQGSLSNKRQTVRVLPL